MHQQNKTRGEYYQNFYPLADWDSLFTLTKSNSFYYELLVKQHGVEFADLCWTKRLQLEKERDQSPDSFSQLYQAVKDYKPRDPLCLIGDLSWGYNSINQYAHNKAKTSLT